MLEYTIEEGKNHHKNTPLYRVKGVNNDYVGEWHKKEKTANEEHDRLVYDEVEKLR